MLFIPVCGCIKENPGCYLHSVVRQRPCVRLNIIEIFVATGIENKLKPSKSIIHFYYTDFV